MSVEKLPEAATVLTARQAPLCHRGGDISFRVASEADVDALDRLNMDVICALGVPGRFMRQDWPFFSELIGCKDACIFLAEQAGKPAAYSIAARACPDIPAFGDNAANGGGSRSTGLLFGTAVDPPLRGFGLQRLLIALRMASLRRIGCLRMQTTVSPFNGPSLANLMDTGFKVIGLKRILDGHFRFIMDRPDLLNGITDIVEKTSKQNGRARRVLCNEESIDGHNDLLAAGWLGHDYAGAFETEVMEIIYVQQDMALPAEAMTREDA